MRQKQERRDTRWTPFNERREAAIGALDASLSGLSNNYCFLTAAVLVMSFVGYFYLPIMEVGFLVGFENFSYFIKRFREVFACTPTEYRKKAREV